MPKIFKIIFSTNAPNFLCLPERVKGMPIRLEMRALNAETPKNLFQEKPPLFIIFPNLYDTLRIQDIYLNQPDLTRA